MRRDEPLPADFRTNAERPAFSRGARIELGLALLVVVAFFELKPAIERWLDAKTAVVQTSALGRCRPPTEFEQLHIVVAHRGDAYALVHCLHVGSRGTYTR